MTYANDHSTAVGPARRSPLRVCGLLYTAMLAHVAVQWCLFGVRDQGPQLDQLWQLPAARFMRAEPVESVLYWHAYASGFVAYWVGLIHVFGEPAAKIVYQWVNLIVGAGLAPAAYLIALATIGSRHVAVVAAVLVGASPSIPLAAASYNYDFPSMALVTMVVAGIACFQMYDRKSSFLVASLWLLSLLVCIRSFFHLALPVCLLAWIVSRRPGWRYAVASAAAVAVPLAMYVKNWVLFGVFGASTMLGFNLSKVDVAVLSKDEARQLGRDGVLPPIVAANPLFYSLVFGDANYARYGYDQRRPSELLNQNDFNNINMIGISRVYRGAALKMMVVRPKTYLRGLAYSTWMFCYPPARAEWFVDDPRRIAGYRKAYLYLVDGEWVVEPLRRLVGHRVIPSVRLVTLPLLLLAGLARPFRTSGLAVGRFTRYLTDHTAECCVTALLWYGTLLGVFCERGENTRYFLYIEPLYLITLTVAATRVCRRFIGSHRSLATAPHQF